jgi:hypothetical protein
VATETSACSFAGGESEEDGAVKTAARSILCRVKMTLILHVFGALCVWHVPANSNGFELMFFVR